MRKPVSILVAVAVAVGGLWLGWNLLMAGPGGCPTALLEGVLTEQDGTLVVASVPDGTVSVVTWPFGYGVGTDEDGTLTLTRLFAVVAREGDPVSMGGAPFAYAPGTQEPGDPVFVACGPVTIGLTQPPEELPAQTGATLRVTGTALEPCIPPPSGCAYWATFVSPTTGTDVAPFDLNRTFESAATGEPEPMTLGPGLPPRVDPGVYELVFEVGVFSDTATRVPLGDGTSGFVPERTVACQVRLDVLAAAADVAVHVTFEGLGCTVETEVTVADREQAEASAVRTTAERALRTAAMELTAPAGILGRPLTGEDATAWTDDIRRRLGAFYAGEALQAHVRGVETVIRGWTLTGGPMPVLVTVSEVTIPLPAVDGDTASVDRAVIRYRSRYLDEDGQPRDVGTVRMCELSLARGEDGAWRVTEETCNESGA